MESPTGCYTLLADDNSSFSNAASLKESFKAHLIYNLILNGRIAFSDNQVICSSNLQKLAATDPTVIALLENGFFDLAVREAFDAQDGRASLRSIHAAFVEEKKIRHAALEFDATPALSLIERFSRPIPWSYDRVRSNFTDNCERLLRREFRPLLSDAQFERLEEILAGEKERDRGLGREFLQNRLHLKLRRSGIRVDKERRELIRRCTDAPYLSNLPSSIGLNPIYAEEHRASFALMRGGDHQFETIGERKAPSRFDYRHYVHGLCRLDMDDILFLQDLPARKTYLRLSNGCIREQRHYDEAFDAFVEFNLMIESRIAARFPELARRSPGDPGRSFFKQKAKSYAAAAADDLFGILVGMLCPMLPLALCKQLIMDAWPGGDGQPVRSVPAELLDGEVARRRLGNSLAALGQGETILVENRPVGGTSFTKEIIIS